MKRILFAVACLCTSLSHAQVYKWVDEQGEIHFGDQPPSRETAEKIKIPQVQSYRPRPLPEAESGEGGETTEQQAAPFDGYDSVVIVQPANGSTVRSNEQKVTVFVSLKPDLQADHQVSLLLDGSVIGAGAVNAPVDLTGVVRGTHSLQVRVTDAAGEVQIESSAVSFTLRQSGIAPFSQPQNPGAPRNPTAPALAN